MPKPKKKEYDDIYLGKELRDAFRKQGRFIKKHMDTDGWDLDSRFQFDEALKTFFGREIHDLFLGEVLGITKGTWGSSMDSIGRTVFKKAKGTRKRKACRRKKAKRTYGSKQ